MFLRTDMPAILMWHISSLTTRSLPID
jgi:hypothetical protein